MDNNKIATGRAAHQPDPDKLGRYITDLRDAAVAHPIEAARALAREYDVAVSLFVDERTIQVWVKGAHACDDHADDDREMATWLRGYATGLEQEL